MTYQNIQNTAYCIKSKNQVEAKKNYERDDVLSLILYDKNQREQCLQVFLVRFSQRDCHILTISCNKILVHPMLYNVTKAHPHPETNFTFQIDSYHAQKTANIHPFYFIRAVIPTPSSSPLTHPSKAVQTLPPPRLKLPLQVFARAKSR